MYIGRGPALVRDTHAHNKGGSITLMAGAVEQKSPERVAIAPGALLRLVTVMSQIVKRNHLSKTHRLSLPPACTNESPVCMAQALESHPHVCLRPYRHAE